MTNIVSELRELAELPRTPDYDMPLLYAAADEIERLQRELRIKTEACEFHRNRANQLSAERGADEPTCDCPEVCKICGGRAKACALLGHRPEADRSVKWHECAQKSSGFTAAQLQRAKYILTGGPIIEGDAVGESAASEIRELIAEDCLPCSPCAQKGIWHPVKDCPVKSVRKQALDDVVRLSEEVGGYDLLVKSSGEPDKWESLRGDQWTSEQIERMKKTTAHEPDQCCNYPDCSICGLQRT